MSGAWIVGGASALGAGHQRRTQPNQDALGWRSLEGGQGFVAAVSDGHGAAAYHRSEVGSRLAVDAALAVLQEALDAPPGSPDALTERLLATWQLAVLAHIEAHPLSDDWVEAAEDKLTPYGATLIAVGASRSTMIAVQIGDGDLLVGMTGGALIRPLPDDEGLTGEQTFSLCSVDALARFRTALWRREAAWPDFAMLSTDGVSKSFADETAFQGVARHYREALQAVAPQSLFEPLPDWLAEMSRRGSGDDATLCLAAWKSPDG